MAEVQNSSSTKQKGVKRVNKKSTRVDLTPMVDLGFLLITFFVFTTTMATPKVLDIVVPNDTDPTKPTTVCESCVITAILGKNDVIYYYEGMPENNSFLNKTTFSAEGIRSVLLKKKNKVKMVKGSVDDMVLIIKPTAESVFKNFVDVLDEVKINGIKHYFIDEISVEDKKLFKKFDVKQLYIN